MDTQTIIDALRAFAAADFEWKFGLYSARKSRDGVELDWNLCAMRGIPDRVETLKTVLLEKTLSERVVTEYSPLLPKENIPAMGREDGLVREALWTVLADLKNGLTYAAEDFISGAVSRPVGYGFYGFQKDAEGKIAEEVLFIRRSNPFLNGGRAALFASSGGEAAPTNTPLLRFAPQTDFLLLGGVCYFFSPGVEKDFDLENRNFAIAAKRMGQVSEAGIVSNFEKLEEAAYAAKNARKFARFDKEIFEHIVRMDISEREDFLLKYGVTIDERGRMDTWDVEQCELIIDLLCGKSCLDALGRLAVGNIAPRE